MRRTRIWPWLVEHSRLASVCTLDRLRSPFALPRWVTIAVLLALTSWVSSGLAADRAPNASPQGIVSAANSTAPIGIRLVGTKNGVASPAGLFTVTVRDLGNNPMPGLVVEFDVTNQPDLRLSTTQPYPGVTAISCFKVRALTNGAGVATFNVVGNASARTDFPSAVGQGATISVLGTLISSPIVAAFDLDGANGCDAGDVFSWTQDLGTGLSLGRSDYDFNGSVGANDVSLLTAESVSGNSSESGVGCVVPTVPDQALEGGLTLGWDNCRLVTNLDKFFACNINTGAAFHLVGALRPVVTIPDAQGFEAILDVVSLSGPLPDWWKLQFPGGCRTALNSLDPSSNLSITCPNAGGSSAMLVGASYPFGGDPAVERIVVTSSFVGTVGLESTLQTALFDLSINRAKTTGVGSCAGCSGPVKIILRSIRVLRGDPNLPPAQRPPSAAFIQAGGSAVRWQSNTPTFPININATAIAGASTFQVNGGPCLPVGSPQLFMLPEGAHELQLCGATCPSAAASPILFEVDAIGHVNYLASTEGALTGAGTSTLVVHSVTFPPPGDDVAGSMGAFRLVVEPKFWTMMEGYPGYGIINGLHRLVSPTLTDFATVIGRSSLITQGSAQDLGGVPVGIAGIIVADSMFRTEPPGFDGPAGTPEVHTEIHDLNLTNGIVSVRAGLHAPSRPNSVGEIQAVPGATGLFPANSFFNVYVEVDAPLLGTLYNSEPLMVENSNISCFPPTVVYIHRHTGPVLMRFKADDTQLPKRWLADEAFGWLVLAGHLENLDGFSPANGRTPSRLTLAGPEADLFAALNAEPEMADAVTLVVDVHDAVTFAPTNQFAQPQFRDSLNLGIDHAAGLGLAGNPCAGLFEAARLYQRVDSLPAQPDWVTAAALRRVIADRISGLMAQLLAQANQSGGCPPGTLDAKPGLPKEFALLGVRPNPTSGSSTTRYALPSAARVNISVYDVSGRHVRTLVDATLPAGTYQAIWDGHQDRAGGRMATSGTYFIRFSAAGHTESRRVVIVR